MRLSLAVGAYGSPALAATLRVSAAVHALVRGTMRSLLAASASVLRSCAMLGQPRGENRGTRRVRRSLLPTCQTGSRWGLSTNPPKFDGAPGPEARRGEILCWQTRGRVCGGSAPNQAQAGGAPVGHGLAGPDLATLPPE